MPSTRETRVLERSDEIVGDVGRGDAVILVVDRDDHQEVALLLRDVDALLLHRLRQAAHGLLHLVLHLHLRGIRVGALGERRLDRHLAGRAAGGSEIEQAIETGELLFDDLSDAGLDGFSRRSRIVGADADRTAARCPDIARPEGPPRRRVRRSLRR